MSEHLPKALEHLHAAQEEIVEAAVAGENEKKEKEEIKARLQDLDDRVSALEGDPGEPV